VPKGFFNNLLEVKLKEADPGQTIANYVEKVTLPGPEAHLDVETWKDNKIPWKYGIGIVLTLDLERPWEILAKPSAEAYPQKDMRPMILYRVVRDHEIKVEQFSRSKTGSVTVAIRRGL